MSQFEETNYIPKEATVTLPAAKYFALVRMVSEAEQDKQVQIDGVRVELKDGKISLRHSSKKAFAKDLALEVGKQLASNPQMMDVCVKTGEVNYDPYCPWLSSYNFVTNFDLRNVPEFARALQWAEKRKEERDVKATLEAQDKDEQ